MDNKVLGARLKLARERLGLTQEGLVERLGKKTVAAISEYENGKRGLTAADLPDFARALQVPVSYFYADVLTEGDLEGALMDWFRHLPTPRSRDHAFRLIQTVIPGILRESAQAVELPDAPAKPVVYEAKKKRKRRQ